VVTPALLRAWPLPEAGSAKDFRGRLLVVGGARKVPGAAQLAGLAALRVGAGVLTMAVAESVAVAVAVATPESGVIGLAEDERGSVTGQSLERLDSALADADAILIGPGLVEPEGTKRLLRGVIAALPEHATVCLDAFALGVLSEVWDDVSDRLAGRLVITPNREEARRLLELDAGSADEPAEELTRPLAERYSAVVCCQHSIAHPDGRLWTGGSGHGGLGTSGSGDVLAGAISGLLARGADLAQATCWASYLHATAGDRLAVEIGPIGFLARDLVRRLPTVMAELHAH
jgi:hydroxyethylthiazole kinase-like uncharacterized protein yjeF